jgi:hypothetical protein
MSQSNNDEILRIMKNLGTGQSLGKKRLKLNAKTKQLEETTENDPDALHQIDPSDAIVFLR